MYNVFNHFSNNHVKSTEIKSDGISICFIKIVIYIHYSLFFKGKWQNMPSKYGLENNLALQVSKCMQFDHYIKSKFNYRFLTP